MELESARRRRGLSHTVNISNRIPSEDALKSRDYACKRTECGARRFAERTDVVGATRDAAHTYYSRNWPHQPWLSRLSHDVYQCIDRNGLAFGPYRCSQHPVSMALVAFTMSSAFG